MITQTDEQRLVEVLRDRGIEATPQQITEWADHVVGSTCYLFTRETLLRAVVRNRPSCSKLFDEFFCNR